MIVLALLNFKNNASFYEPVLFMKDFVLIVFSLALYSTQAACDRANAPYVL